MTIEDVSEKIPEGLKRFGSILGRTTGNIFSCALYGRPSNGAFKGFFKTTMDLSSIVLDGLDKTYEKLAPMLTISDEDLHYSEALESLLRETESAAYDDKGDSDSNESVLDCLGCDSSAFGGKEDYDEASMEGFDSDYDAPDDYSEDYPEKAPDDDGFPGEP